MKTHSITLLALLALLLLSCREDKRCANGTCTCSHGKECDIECEAPPCHVICMDQGTYCEAECGNGDCVCGPGARCDFFCQSPPCHVSCEGNSHCTGECANGDCTCAAGSTCSFDCLSGPCHVNCEGDHPSCDGTCANGTCNCGPNSDCRFSCLDSDCSAVCEAGSACVLECPDGNPGEQGCDFVTCAAGDVRICADGIHTVCGASCPEA